MKWRGGKKVPSLLGILRGGGTETVAFFMVKKWRR